MKFVSPADQIFLLLERRQQPMHIGTLQLFTYPEDAKADYVSRLAEHMRSFTQVQAPFNQRIVTRFGQPFWEEDRQFDLDHHFRHAALPKPGRIRELLAFISAEHSNLLDRERPLWEIHLIEGVQGRRFAVYTKIHHSLMDGMAGMRLMMRAFSNTPETQGLPPIWAVPPRQRKASADKEKSGKDMAATLAKLKQEAGRNALVLPHVAREVGRSLTSERQKEDFVSVFDAPPSVLNQRITGSRRFAAQSYSMARIRAIGKAFGATVNDVVMAMCGAALRDYLISQNALPEKPLIAMVPVSLRDDDESEGGNQIAVVLANLGTHVDDPAERIRIVMGSIREAKQRCKRMSSSELLLYTAVSLAPAGVNMLTGLAPQWQSFNVIISNVPGPKEHMYWNGARMDGIYPVAFLMDNAALNFTLLSYVDQLEFGITACRRTLPSMQRLLDYLEKALDDLETAVGITEHEAALPVLA
ncbi:MAG: wax ester/triacylglycerol synthase family O-acyltransferase [Pedobacter sp.]|nr:wax ester/triacylglycerol synthase family O-acyltransferase [Pedobacter sp.]